jgi:putative hydrolase of the HAD superfamily
LRYDTVFLDVDGTLLWVDLDVEGYVEDLSPYATNGGLSAERATGPLWESLRTHISENINYPTKEELAAFKLANTRKVARSLGIEAPTEVLTGVTERRMRFNPYPESEGVMEELREMGYRLYAVSNWDILLEEVLRDLDWTRYFDGIFASAAVGLEKPEGRIFEEALEASGRSEDRGRVVHVGNDPVSDVRGASRAGIAVVMVDREGGVEAPEASLVLPDLRGLPEVVRGSDGRGR